jgi:RNA polymerase sigma factor (TIGR02999 family)
MLRPDAGEVTRLLHSWHCGNKEAIDQLVPLLYGELHRLAAVYLRRERRDHTLQPTALVHETYLKLVGHAPARSESRTQFFAIAANLMRQILVDSAKQRGAAKRGGGLKVTLEDAADLSRNEEIDLVALDRALERLARLDPRQSRIVELRFFGGLTEDEIAGILCVSAITVKRDWRIAKAVLQHALDGGKVDDLP